MITGNKGEWSEVYALFKLLGDQKLYSGNEDLLKIEDLVYPILKILKSENSNNFEYALNEDANVIISIDGRENIKIPVATFEKKAKELLSKIKTSSGRAFSIPEIEEFMSSFNSHSLKAKSSVKTDINIMIHDLKTKQTPILGFSIKSQLGSPSTLLNAGKTTNFVYRIENVSLSDDDIKQINFCKKIREKIEFITEKGGSLVYNNLDNSTFKNNLILIDSNLDSIMAEVILVRYSSLKNRLKSIVTELNQNNPLKYDISGNHEFYSYKIKRFLTDIALGMMPSKVWDGKYDSTGGYLIVKEDGDVLCYHIYNKNDFENYLLNNTKLDTASTSRYDFGHVYKDGDYHFIKLNLQIRFLK